MITLVRSAAPLAFVLAAAPLHAQSFNVDAGSNPAFAPVPSASYAGAAGQTGQWNQVDKTPGHPGILPTPLFDLDGNPTGATLSLTSVWFASIHSYSLDSTIGGDQAALMEDWVEIGAGGPAVGAYLSVGGLANGAYEIFTYAWVLDLDSPSVVEGQTVAGSWPGDHNQGQSYARHRIDVTAGSFSFFIQALWVTSGKAAFNGLQIVKLDGGSRSFCAGTNATCPCGNGGDGNGGCASSFDPNGALITASGVASVSADSLVLHVSGVSNATVSFFQGTQTLQGGAGAAFGDGLRCAGGIVRRIVSKPASAHQMAYPEGTEIPISIRGALTPAGGERVYQARYRNSMPFCTTDTFNYSNGVAIAWSP